MLRILYGCKTDMVTAPKAEARVGRLCVIPFESEESGREFSLGYRSGMARIWRTTYSMPKRASNWRVRGFRFAWLAHWVGKREGNDQFPEITLFIDGNEVNLKG